MGATTGIPLPFRQLLSLGLIIFSALIPMPFVDDWGWYLAVPASMAGLFLFGMMFLGHRLFDAFNPNGCATGVPLIDMATMAMATQNDCWSNVKRLNDFDMEARKAKLLGSTEEAAAEEEAPVD